MTQYAAALTLRGKRDGRGQSAVEAPRRPVLPSGRRLAGLLFGHDGRIRHPSETEPLDVTRVVGQLMVANSPRHEMKLKALATAVTTSLATVSFANDLMGSLAIADGIETGKPGYVDLSRYGSDSSVVVVQGYPELESQDEDADIELFQAGYFAYTLKIVSLIIVAKNRQSAEWKANVFKEEADRYVLSRFPENGAGKLHVSDEPMSNADAVSLAGDAEIVLTIY